MKPPPASIVDDLLATQKLNVSIASGTKAGTDDNDGTPLCDRPNSFASFVASGLGLGAQDRAMARGRGRGDAHPASQAPAEGSGPPKIRRLSRKQSKVRNGSYGPRVELTLWWVSIGIW
jgi:hypothetical protein